MLQEFIQEISRMAVDAKLPRAFHPEQEPAHVYYMVDDNGLALRTEASPRPRQATASDEQAVLHFATAGASEDFPAEIWFCRQNVVCLLDAGTRRDTVTLPMRLSTQIQALAKMEASAVAMDQKAFLRFLRIDLAGSGVQGVVDAVRQVKFRQQAETASAIAHTKASLGKTVEAQLACVSALPGEVVLHVPVFAGFLADTTFRVNCALDVDPAAEKFVLVPYPGECEGAVRAAEARLGHLLQGGLGAMNAEYVSLLYGAP